MRQYPIPVRILFSEKNCRHGGSQQQDTVATCSAAPQVSPDAVADGTTGKWWTYAARGGVACRTDARLRQGKPGKGGKRCKKHRRNLSEEPSGPRAHPVESGQQPEASLASWRGDPP